jgi:hypothetical protein
VSWDAYRRKIAEPTTARVHGIPSGDGVQLKFVVQFDLVEWPHWETGQPVSVLPQPADITARTPKGVIRLGHAFVTNEAVVVPPRHSSDTAVHYTLHLTSRALVALETVRDGGALEFEMGLVAVAHMARSEESMQRMWHEFRFAVSRDDWTELLKDVGFCDTLVTELRLPTTGPEATAKGRDRLKAAVNDRDNGSYAGTMRQCRIALDELKNAGFGGKAPQEVAQFLQANAGSMTQVERFSALQLALQLLLSPAHHAGALDEEYSREDAELAIAMTAALLKMAPRWDSAGSN